MRKRGWLFWLTGAWLMYHWVSGNRRAYSRPGSRLSRQRGLAKKRRRIAQRRMRA